MSAWVMRTEFDRQGRVSEQVVAVDLDPLDVLALVDVSQVTDEPPRFVRVDVKFRQVPDGPGGYTYRPDSARAYVTAGRPR